MLGGVYFLIKAQFFLVAFFIFFRIFIFRRNNGEEICRCSVDKDLSG